jgi:Tol biopolymer transport system component
VVNRDGTGLRQLTDDPELDDSPAWSPDGQRIAFRSYRAGYDGEIWVMNSDGSGLVNLTPTTGTAIVDHRRPSWSPDGKFIVHASTLGGNWDIWVMGADGSDQRRLTNTADLDAEPAWSTDGSRIAFRRTDATGSDIMIVPASGGEAVRIALAGDQRAPSWPPAGSMLAFSSQATAASRPEIMIMTPGGQGIRAITSGAWGGATEPAWSATR